MILSMQPKMRSVGIAQDAMEAVWIAFQLLDPSTISRVAPVELSQELCIQRSQKGKESWQHSDTPLVQLASYPASNAPYCSGHRHCVWTQLGSSCYLSKNTSRQKIAELPNTVALSSLRLEMVNVHQEVPCMQASPGGCHPTGSSRGQRSFRAHGEAK